MGEIAQLSNLLKQSEAENDKEKCFQLVCKVISFMTSGIDVSSLFFLMIKASFTDNLVQKKLVYFYLRTYATQKEDLTILMINTLNKDGMNLPNPYLRVLATRYMSSFKSSQVIEYVVPVLIRGLQQDSSSHLQQTAVIGSCKLFHFSKSHFQEMKFLSFLSPLAVSKNLNVASTTLWVLTEVETKTERNINFWGHLFSKFSELDIWNQCFLLNAISKFSLQSNQFSQNRFDIMV